MRRICKVENCDRYSRANGYCSAHYMQIKENGEIRHLRTEPNEIEIIGDIAYITLYDRHHKPLSYKVLIDSEDVGKISTYRITHHKTAMYRNAEIIIKRKRILLHRFLMNPLPGISIDHINHNGFDNRKSNLRICTHQQNCFNRFYKGGISYAKRQKKWKAGIKKNGKHHHLGYFKNKEDALKARIDAEKRLFGEFAPIRT